MCEEWRDDFSAFFAYVGPCPSKYSLDRINNDGHYEPGNVRWATATQQAQNKRKSRRPNAPTAEKQPVHNPRQTPQAQLSRAPDCALIATSLETHEHQQHFVK